MRFPPLKSLCRAVCTDLSKISIINNNKSGLFLGTNISNTEEFYYTEGLKRIFCEHPGIFLQDVSELYNNIFYSHISE